MRVTPAALPPVAREHGKPAAAEQPRFKLNATPTDVGKLPEKAAAPAAIAGRQLPPGLDRVMARLEAMPAESRNAGQSNALDRIGRNIARYQENHGLTPPAAPESPSPVAETPAVVAPVETAPQTPDAPVVTTPELPAETVAAAPEAEPGIAPVVNEPAPIVAAPVVDPLAVLPAAPPAGSTIDVQA